MIRVPGHVPALVALTLSTFAPSDARASEPGDKSAAEALFRGGRSLMEQKKFAEACPKLAESQRLDPAAGTLMNLGRCYEGNHQTASAWVTFTEAAKAAAARHRDDWRATALARVRALEPKLATMIIVVAEEARAAGLVVKRDASEVREPEWGIAIPVDAGAHEIAASSPGHVAWSKSVSIVDGDRVTVAVPALADAPAEKTAPLDGRGAAAAGDADAATGARDDAHGPWRTIGIVAIGVGAAGLVTGSVTGLLASAAGKDADRMCPSSPCTDRGGLDASSRAHALAAVSTASFIAGGVLAAGGIAFVLWDGGSHGANRSRAAAAPAYPPTSKLERSFRVEILPASAGLRLVGELW